MSKPHLDGEGISIVLLGSFNPQIFHPSWFAAHGLIRKEEEDSAKVQVTHPDVSMFALGWMRIEVEKERFVATTTTKEHFQPQLLRDIVMGTFKLLRHTPLKALGINSEFGFKMPDEKSWHDIGHKLAPKEPWAGLLEKPGMFNTTIQGQRTDGRKGIMHVSVQPAIKTVGLLVVRVNDHFDASDAKPQMATELMDILEKVWTESLARARHISYGVVGAQS